MAQAQLSGTQPATPVEKRRVTLEEYLRLLDDRPYEVIDGELIAMSPQQFDSSWVGHVIYDSIHDFAHGKKLGIVLMETAYSLEIEQTTNWVEGALVPDVSFMRREQMQKQIKQYGRSGALRFAPDIAVEIVSPTDSFTEVNKKVSRYLQYGVKLVFVIDPQLRAAHVHTPQQPDGRILHDGDTLDGGDALPGWSLAITELFDASPED